jgi:peptide/nickel transport system permease protein
MTETGVVGELPFIEVPTTTWHRVWRQVIRFFRYKPLGAFGAVVIAFLLVAAMFSDWMAPYSYDDFDVSRRLQGPSWDHPFGTDPQGRDIFSRVIYGSRTSVLVAAGSLAIAMVGATLIGVTAGWFGGLWDLISQRIIDIWLAMPGLVFLILLISIFGRSMSVLLVALGVLFVAGSSRIVRSATLGLKGNQYVEAARTLGATDIHIMLRHILPNVAPIIIVTFSIQVGSVILVESTLAFLGFGLPPPFPSWGRMLQEAQEKTLNSPHLAVFPGAAIALTVFAFNVFGDALRDVLDPRLRQR